MNTMITICIFAYTQKKYKKRTAKLRFFFRFVRGNYVRFDERKKEWKRRAKALERYAQQIQLLARFFGFQTFLNNLAES